MVFSTAVFQDKNARLLVGGQFVSQLCDRSMTVGLIWWLAQTGQEDLIPWFLGLTALPHLVMIPWSGAWVQKLGPLKTLVDTDRLRGILFLLLGLLWPFMGTSLQVPVLFLCCTLANFAASLFNPAIYSIPSLLPSYAQIPDEEYIGKLNGLLQFMVSLTSVLGPLTTMGISLALKPDYSWPFLFLINSASYFWAASLEGGVRLKQSTEISSEAQPSAATPAAPVPSPVPSPWTVATKNPMLLQMLLGFLCSNLFLSPLMVFLPLFAKDRFSGSLTTYGWLETVLALGTVIGGAWMAVRSSSPKSLLRSLQWGLFIVSLSYFIFTLDPEPLGAGVLLVILGFALSVSNVLIMTLFQSEVPAADIPIFMSVVNLIGFASLPVAMVGLGLLLKSFSILGLAWVCAGLLLVVTLVLVFSLEKWRAHPSASSSKDSHIDLNKA